MSERDRITFTVRTADGRFEASARAEWRELDPAYRLLLVELQWPNGQPIPLDEAAEACGLTVPQLRLQLRIAAIYADRERELRPSVRPLVWIACGPKREELRVIEGRLVA